MQDKDEVKKKRKKPLGKYYMCWNVELQCRVRTFIPDRAPTPKPFRLLLLLRSAFSPLFPQIFTNRRLLYDFFLAPKLLSSGTKGDVAALALTCKAFKSLQRRKSKKEVHFDITERSELLYPARFIASLSTPKSGSVLTTLHIGVCGLDSAELCFELGDVFTQGLPVLRELTLYGISALFSVGLGGDRAE